MTSYYFKPGMVSHVYNLRLRDHKFKLKPVNLHELRVCYGAISVVRGLKRFYVMFRHPVDAAVAQAHFLNLS